MGDGDGHVIVNLSPLYALFLIVYFLRYIIYIQTKSKNNPFPIWAMGTEEAEDEKEKTVLIY
jgi:tellurite resistance protein TehA-like permease